MIDFLAGVPGKLNTLLNRLTATWAAKLDTLHDSRLTSARAGYMDKLNVVGKVVDDAVWTPARAAQLDLTDTLSGTAPKVNGLRATKVQFRHGTEVEYALERAGEYVAINGVKNVYAPLLSITGAGRISFLVVLGPTSVHSLTGVRITVDGTNIYEINSGFSAGDGSVGYGLCPIGVCATDTSSLPKTVAIGQGMPVPFKASFLVEVKTSDVSSGLTVKGFFSGQVVS